MAAKRFLIERPDQLRTLSYYSKEQPSRLDSLISVWAATRRRSGKTPWDGAIFAGFSGDVHKAAAVVRITVENELVMCAPLKYNIALNWCERHLRQV